MHDPYLTELTQNLSSAYERLSSVTELVIEWEDRAKEFRAAAVVLEPMYHAYYLEQDAVRLESFASEVRKALEGKNTNESK